MMQTDICKLSSFLFQKSRQLTYAADHDVKAASAPFLFFGVWQVEAVQIISFGCAI